VQQLPIRFIIAGDLSWNNPFGQALVKRVSDLGLQKEIEFVGFVDDIESLYASAHLHVAPTVSEEPYGLTIVEAKAHGVPSIVFPSGRLVELVDYGCDGWVCESPTAASLEAAIRQYVIHPAISSSGARPRYAR
jgi:glycosyltransferase involved in cell wall biosynthesis